MTDERKSTIPIDHIKVQLDMEKKGILLILAILVFFGITAIISQYFLPEIIKLAGFEIIGLPEPSLYAVFLDTWGDMVFTGTIIALFYGFRAFSGELNVNKPGYFLLSRPISRSDYYLTKSVLRLSGVISCLLVSSIVIYLLGLLLFDPIEVFPIIIASVLIGFGVSAMLSITLMLNSKLSTGVTLGIGVVIIMIFTTITLISPYVQWLVWFSPLSLMSIWQTILLESDFENTITHLFVLLIWNIIPLIVGNYFYNKRDL